MRGRGNKDRRPHRTMRSPDRSPRSTPHWRARHRRSARTPAPQDCRLRGARSGNERIASASASPTSRASTPRSSLGRRERIDEGLVLLRRRSMLTDIMLYGSQTHEWSQRDSGGGGPPLDAMGRSMRSIVHPENLRRQASPALPARPSHQSPPHENKWSNPSAPSSP